MRFCDLAPQQHAEPSTRYVASVFLSEEVRRMLRIAIQNPCLPPRGLYEKDPARPPGPQRVRTNQHFNQVYHF